MIKAAEFERRNKHGKKNLFLTTSHQKNSILHPLIIGADTPIQRPIKEGGKMNTTELLSLDPKTKSSKELIIHILGNRWPLTAKEIHHALLREQGYQSTYQAVHKGIQELELSGIIQKEGKKFRLSREWIGKSKSYFDSLDIAYENNEYVIDQEKTIIFNNYTDFSLTLGHMFNSRKLLGPKYTDCYAMTRHLFWPLKFSFKDFELCISVGLNARPHIICRHDTPFDKLIKRHYELAKWPSAIIGADIPGDEDIIVQGHTKMKITQNPQVAELMIENIKSKIKENAK